MNIKEKLVDITSLGASVELLLPCITFNSNQQALVEGCKGVLEYNNSAVRLNCGKVVLKFQGQNLSIKALSLEQINVSGEILSVEFLS